MLRIFKKKYTNKRELEIKIISKYINWYKLLVQQWNLFPNYTVASDTIKNLKEYKDYIKNRWKKNPELSLGEILSLLGFLPKNIISSSKTSTWYYEDYEDIMCRMNVPERDYLIWRSSYNIFGKRRKHAVYQLVKDMSSYHIKKILNSSMLIMSDRYAQVLKDELTLRGTKPWATKL
jgi:hypothetical protein